MNNQMNWGKVFMIVAIVGIGFAVLNSFGGVALGGIFALPLLALCMMSHFLMIPLMFGFMGRNRNNDSNGDNQNSGGCH